MIPFADKEEKEHNFNAPLQFSQPDAVMANYQSFGANQNASQKKYNNSSHNQAEQRPLQSKGVKSKTHRPPKHPVAQGLSKLSHIEPLLHEQIEHVPLIPHDSRHKASYASIELNRGSAKQKYASPRSNASSHGGYSSKFNQQNTSLNDGRPGSSARKPGMNHPLSMRNSNSLGKLVHMRPNKEYENMSSQHQESVCPSNYRQNSHNFSQVKSADSNQNVTL